MCLCVIITHMCVCLCVLRMGMIVCLCYVSVILGLYKSVPMNDGYIGVSFFVCS